MMHGILRVPPHRQPVSRHKRIKRGEAVAARRALTAATIYGSEIAPTLAKAAAGCGTTIQYIRAAIGIDPVFEMLVSASA
jgi:hypothetical protein